MLSNLTETRNISAQSKVGDDVLMFMSASLNSLSGANITKSIQNTVLYRQYQDEADQDFEEFQKYALGEKNTK